VRNEERFHAFYDSTRKALYGYLYRVVEDAATAQDLFQEAYLKLLSANVENLDDVALRAYLFRIATNLLRDRFRKRRRERQWEEEAHNSEPNQQVSESMTDNPTEVLKQLSPQNRSLLLLAYVEGYNHKQIATMLGLSTGSIRVLIFRAKKKMLSLLSKASDNLESAS
jgi:RNA polymerase sigma-70 factor (ECF subfamily)